MDRMLRPPATKVMILLGLGHMLLRPISPRVPVAILDAVLSSPTA